jgi:hypothetical protein
MIIGATWELFFSTMGEYTSSYELIHTLTFCRSLFSPAKRISKLKEVIE